MDPKINYLLWAAAHRRTADTSCPACGSNRTATVKVKSLVTALVACEVCSLRFRTPKDDPAVTADFYAEEKYKQGFTTDLPSAAELNHLLLTKFEGNEKDFAYRLGVLRIAGLSPGARVLDFGSSWGYGSWQLRQAGYDVYSYEVGQDRARYAREKLDCNVVSNLRMIDGQMDCFFSADVIEHLPNPNLLFEEASETLKPGGLLVCYCPNGAKERERAQPKEYHRNWGMVHPVYITPEYLAKQAQKTGFAVEMIRSDSWDWGLSGTVPPQDPLTGSELLLIARKLGA